MVPVKAFGIRKFSIFLCGTQGMSYALFCLFLFGFAGAGAVAQETSLTVEAQIEQAKALIEAKKYQEAVARLDEVLNIDRKNATAWYWKGRAYHALGDTATAAKCYERALRERSNLTEAVTYLTKIKNQSQLEAWYQAAETSWRRADWQGVENSYEKILALDPEYKDVPSKLRIAQNKKRTQEVLDGAMTLRQQQRFDEAISSLQRAIKLGDERAFDFQEMIKQIEQEKRQAANKSKTPVESPQILPQPSKRGTALAATKDSSAPRQTAMTKDDSLINQPQKTSVEQPRQNFSIGWVTTAGAAILIMVIAFVLLQKFRAKPQAMAPSPVAQDHGAGATAIAIAPSEPANNSRFRRIPLKATDAWLPRLDRYRLDEELGRGGMGLVYKAYDLKLERPVALKLIRLDNIIDSQEVEERIARFRREAKAIARLNHPNIVSLHDYDEAEGMLYMIMEYVEGRSVEQMLNAKRQLGVRAAIKIIKQVCWALDYAHKNGIIHRDIKPSNIMVNTDDVVKVVDFGVAKMLGATKTQVHTMTGMRLGSPFYMSPEQIEALELDSRSDIYSLGAVFYEMLAGQKPFALNEGNSLSSLFYAILHAEPPKLRTIRPEIPPELEMIVLKMLAKDREQRLGKAREIIEGLSVLRQAA